MRPAIVIPEEQWADVIRTATRQSAFGGISLALSATSDLPPYSSLACGLACRKNAASRKCAWVPSGAPWQALLKVVDARSAPQFSNGSLL